MKYYQVPLKVLSNGVENYYFPDVNEAFLEYRHFDTQTLLCKISVEDAVDVPNGTLLTEVQWGEF